MTHEEKKFLYTEELKFPWPHTILENFFSDQNKDIIKNFYQNEVPKNNTIQETKNTSSNLALLLLSKLSSKSFSLNRKNNHNCYLTINKNTLAKYPILENISNIFKSNLILNHICNKRGDELVKNSILRVQIIRDVSGYSIDPHPDNPKKLFTFQCYFPNNDNDALGTILYDQNKSVIKSIPYKENTAYWFIPKIDGLITWHGFKCTKPFLTRDSVMVNYILDEGFKDGLQL